MESPASTEIVGHTKGPWSVIGQTDILALEETPESIVVASTQFFQGEPTERQLADARLIAASPEMFEVCELTLAFHGADTESFVRRYGHGMTTKELCDRIRVVVAKAEGRADS